MERNGRRFTAILSSVLGFTVAKYVENTYIGILMLVAIFLVIYVVKRIRYKQYKK